MHGHRTCTDEFPLKFTSERLRAPWPTLSSYFILVFRKRRGFFPRDDAFATRTINGNRARLDNNKKDTLFIMYTQLLFFIYYLKRETNKRALFL